MLLDLLEDRRLLFFGGKGGVGKTTLAAATAAGLAGRGSHVLLVSTDPAHNLGHLFDRRIGPNAVPLMAGLDAMELDPDRTVDTHLDGVRATLRKMMPERLHGAVEKHLDSAREAPGMMEAALLERMAIVVEEGLASHDVVVFDTAPSGHTVRLLELPEIMSAWTAGLIDRRRKADGFADALRQFREAPGENYAAEAIAGDEPGTGRDGRENVIRAVLRRRQSRFSKLSAAMQDEALATFVIVLVPEAMPVLETNELYEKLRRVKMPVGALVENRMAPERNEDFWRERGVYEAETLGRLDAKVAALPRVSVPLQPREISGAQQILDFARAYLT
jgi:arsenite-transporting ATPase